MTFITDLNNQRKNQSPIPLNTNFNSNNQPILPSQRSALLLAAHFTKVVPMQKGKIDKTALSRPPYNSVEPKIKIQPYLIQPPRPRTTKPRFYRLREAPNPEIIFEDEFTDPMYRDYLDRIKMQVGGGLLDGNQSSLAKQRQMLRPVTSIAKALRCQVDIGELNVEVYKFK